ncbi:MAG: glycosyltransferase family 9 protein [Comamonadaceae bacterium]|nr:MAG: glycosyltransferase family 9 protein [Comamonadaceae bacterium]
MKRILVIATRQIGDVLLTTPLIRAARGRWPQAHIEVLGFAGTLGMLRGNPDVDMLIESPARLGWRGFWALLRRLWRSYDLALVTQPGDRAHLMGWVAARQRSGIIPERGGSNWWKSALLFHAVHSAGDGGELHVVAEKLALLAPWTGPQHGQVQDGPAKVVPPAPAALPADIESLLTPGAVVLHAPSMWPYKQWPLAHFRALAAALLARGHQLVLTGSAGARDQECVAALRGLAPSPQLLDCSGRLDFNQLANLLGRAALYIGPDTSVSHLAAASGVPVLAIFGPTNPLRWAPWPAQPRAHALFQRVALVQAEGNVTVLQGGGLACVPCSKAGCEDHLQSRSDCLVAITPERVLEQALRLLEPRKPPG